MVAMTRSGLGRRRMRIGIGAAALIVAAGPLAACGSGATGEAFVTVDDAPVGTVASAALTRASESTSAVESGRFRVSYAISGSGDGESLDMTMAGTGSFSDFGQRSELTVEMTGASGTGLGAVPGTMVMHEIVDGTTAYMKVDTDQLIPGLDVGWMKMDVAALAGDPSGSQSFGVMGSDWSGFLDSLKGAGGSVVERGADSIDGVPVTVYEGTIDPQAAIAQASPDDEADVQAALDQMGGTFDMPFTAWVDSDGMVRRLEVTVSADMGGATMDMTVTIELYDLGAPITITPPPADEVTDFGGASGLGGLVGPGLGTA